MLGLNRLFYAAILFLAFQNHIIAAESLTLQQSFDKALNHQQGKQLSEIENARNEARRAAVRVTQSAFLPKVAAMYNYQKAGDDRPNIDSEMDTAKIALTQNVFSGFRDASAIKSAKLSEEAQNLRAEYRQTSIFLSVSDAYFDLALAQSEIAVLDEIDRTIQLRYKDISDRIRIGRSRSTEKGALDSQIALFRAQREKAKQDLIIAQENFKLWTGLSEGITLADAQKDVRPDLPDEASVLGNLESRKDLLAQKKDVESSEQDVKTAKAEHFPTVDLFGNYYFFRPAPQDEVKWDVGVAVTLPIFEGGLTRAKVWQAASTRNELRLTYENKLLNARNDLRISYLQAKSLFSQVLDYQKAAEASERTYKDISREYGLGLVSNLDVLQALNTYLDNYRSRNRVHFQYLASYWNLKILADQTK